MQTYPDKELQKIKDCALRAVNTMREYLDQAERNIAQSKNPEEVIGDTLHAFRWGEANAMAAIESALSSMRMYREIAEYESKKQED